MASPLPGPNPMAAAMLSGAVKPRIGVGRKAPVPATKGVMPKGIGAAPGLAGRVPPGLGGPMPPRMPGC